MSWWSLLYEGACWPFQRYQRGVLAWVLASVLAADLVFTSLREGVDGHITCDFAGQWMHGRAFYRERCEDLYLIEPGKELLAEGYTGKKLDEQVKDILMKGVHQSLYKEGVAGALYPPTASMLFSLLATFTPATAHAVAVGVYLLMIFGSGWFVSRITHGRLQAGEAALLLLFFPNNFMGLMLGQNQALSLFILVSGWYCYHRGWPLVAGLVWGLFAFKPVFAVAMLLVPVCLRNPRWFLGMAITGVVWVGSTLYFTKGIDPWLRWLQVGKHAEQIYQIDQNWIWMSRDLVGLPRRRMWEPKDMAAVMRQNIGVWQPGAALTSEDDDGKQILNPRMWLFWRDKYDPRLHQLVYVDKNASDELISPVVQTVIGYALLGTVALLTVLISWRRRAWQEPADSLGVVFVLTGSLLCVFHFMHYDLLTFGLPVLLTLSQWDRWGWGKRSFFLVWYVSWLFRTMSYFFGNGILEVPWDTYLLILLWLWTGCVRWTQPAEPEEISSLSPVPAASW